MCVRVLATHCARALHFFSALSKTEGAGKTGCALHPRSRVQCASKNAAHEHTGSAESLRPSLRNGFTAYNVIVLVTGFLATIIIGSFRFRQLDASTGASDPHDFAVRFCCARQSQPSRPSLPAPTFATMANAPLVGQDSENSAVDLPDVNREIFLHAGIDSRPKSVSE